ncbi:MAG: 50S ribosomal protein L15 [Bacteroidetes bacterium]|jgi:large subunit ribosomal protein L15|nr:50S ribosomal protein L15 [Bacteroidota bacterium]
MELHNLQPAKGSTKNRKRIGRGVASGKGRTSGRGHKGYLSRSGSKRRANFEGGQTPLQMRLPKFGFNNRSRVEYYPLNLDHIQMYAEKYDTDTIDEDFLRDHRILRKNVKIKILGRGDLQAKVKVSAHAVSAAAQKAIENQGGEITILK